MNHINWILEHKIIAIVRGLSSEHILRLAEALHAGGIRAMEVTFNQASPDSWPDTEAAVRAVADAYRGEMLVGAGTVMTAEQVARAANAGAQYIVSPNTNAEVIRATKDAGLLSLPGALTPTEIALAHDAGADFIKVFPAGALGPNYIKAVRAPLSHVKLLAVGGVNEKNAAEFLRAGCVGIGVGGNLVDVNQVKSGDTAPITALARAYVNAVNPTVSL